MKWVKTYLFSLRRDFAIILGADIAFLMIMEFWLRNIPAPYPVFIRIGDLFVTLGVSYIASLIFYYVQVHMPKIKERERIYPSIAKMFKAILCAETDILTQLLGLNMKEMSEENIREKAKQVDLYAEAPLIIGLSNDHYANNLEYCIYCVGIIDRNTNMLQNVSAYLDSECMDFLIRIQNSETFLVQVRHLFPMYVADGTHKLQYHPPGSYLLLWYSIEEQMRYYDREFKKYYGRN